MAANSTSFATTFVTAGCAALTVVLGVCGAVARYTARAQDPQAVTFADAILLAFFGAALLTSGAIVRATKVVGGWAVALLVLAGTGCLCFAGAVFGLLSAGMH